MTATTPRALDRLTDALRDKATAQCPGHDDDPASRLANWHAIAREHISAELCDRLAQLGMPALALELMRQRGDIS